MPTNHDSDGASNDHPAHPVEHDDSTADEEIEINPELHPTPVDDAPDQAPDDADLADDQPGHTGG